MKNYDTGCLQIPQFLYFSNIVLANLLDGTNTEAFENRLFSYESFPTFRLDCAPENDYRTSLE